MKILILNIGSTTIKWAIYNKNWIKENELENVIDFGSSLKKILLSIKSKHKIDAIGHRIVHGGNIKKSVVLSSKILKSLEKFKEFAPLHQKNELLAVKLCSKIFNAKQIAVFDTSFYSEIPEKAKIYAIPIEFYKKGIKRYGFHGISHEYVTEKIIELMNKKNIKLISCHLGAGCSISAIKNRKAIDTSMGFTPLEGTVMLTRSGSIDPGILIYLQKRKDLSEILNEKSGIYGISKIKDFKKIVQSKSRSANLAHEIFCYSIIKQIGAYAAALNGIDAIAFTGGIGENAFKTRKKILRGLGFLGISIDNKKNKKSLMEISKKSSKGKVFIIKANEKDIILKEVKKAYE